MHKHTTHSSPPTHQNSKSSSTTSLPLPPTAPPTAATPSIFFPQISQILGLNWDPFQNFTPPVPPFEPTTSSPYQRELRHDEAFYNPDLVNIHGDEREKTTTKRKRKTIGSQLIGAQTKMIFVSKLII